MDQDNKQDDNTEQLAPADALSRTPDELEQEEAERVPVTSSEPVEKKQSSFKRFLKQINVYLLLFLLLVVIAGAVAAVTYLNRTQPEAKVDIANQTLDPEALKQLANTDASVSNASQTLTIQGNAVIVGQTLMRGNLNVAGAIQSGGALTVPNLTASGTANLASAQANTLQVASTLAVQGATTMQDLSVAGSASFSGSLTASQITTSRLILSGNAVLQVPNHISFTGPTPGRSMNGGPVGGGGSVSISGSDTTGSIRINTGNNPSAGCFARINFAQAFSTQPHVIVSPVGNAAGRTQYYVDRDNSGFSICAASPAPGNQEFGFDYFVTG